MHCSCWSINPTAVVEVTLYLFSDWKTIKNTCRERTGPPQRDPKTFSRKRTRRTRPASATVSRRSDVVFERKTPSSTTDRRLGIRRERPTIKPDESRKQTGGTADGKHETGVVLPLRKGTLRTTGCSFARQSISVYILRFVPLLSQTNISATSIPVGRIHNAI